MAVAQKAWIEQIQKRLAVTSTILSNMKAAQMLGLKDVLFKVINELRELELSKSSRYRKLLVIVAGLCKNLSFLFSKLKRKRSTNQFIQPMHLSILPLMQCS